MALPANGAPYKTVLQPGINPLTIQKVITCDILIRDYLNVDGTVHNLADPSIGLNDEGIFTPFAADGTLRTDLLGESGLGFYHLASLHDDGLEMTYKTSVAETMIAQSKRPVRYDVTSDADGITIKAVEGIPIVDALRYDLPLDSLKDIGTAGYAIMKPAETPLIERQVIALGFDGDNLVADVFPRMALKDRGNSSWNKKDPDVMELQLGALLCPYVGSDAIKCREGAKWRGFQGNPLFAAAPVATAVTGQKADVVFARPTSKSSTFEYVIEKSNTGTGSWTTATVESVAGTTNITTRVTGVTSSLNWFFRVKATGSNARTTTSANTASIVGLT